MAITADNLTQKTSDSVNTISQSISSTRSSLSNLSSSVNRISLIISNKTKVRTDLILKSRQIEDRRREAAKRRELEDQIEASKVSTDIKSGLNVASSTGKGPLGRILSFLGYMGAGWILENLPTWIAMGKEFIARMRKAGELIYSIPQTMWRILGNFGTLLSSVKQNILNLDFTDSSGEVRDSFKELTDTMNLLGSQIYGGFSSLLQPSGEVEIPSTGEQQPDAEPSAPSQPSPSGGGSGGGGRWQPLLDLIASGESTSSGGYDAMYPGRNTRKEGKPVSEMSISQAARYAGDPGDGRNYAVGRYQFTTVRAQAKSAGLNPDKDLFSPANQDKMAVHIIEGKRYGKDWLSGKITDEKFSEYLAGEWGTFKSASGYVLPGNSGSIGFDKIKLVLKQVKSSSSQTPPKPTVTPQTPTAPPPPKTSTEGTGKIAQYFHGEPGRAGYEPKGHWNHDHFSFTTRAAAVKAFLALRSKGFQPYEFEGYSSVSPPPGHSNTGGHYGPVGGEATVNNTSDGTAFDIPYSSYGSGPIGPKDFAKSREAHKIVLSSLGQSGGQTTSAKPQSVATTTPLMGQRQPETSGTEQVQTEKPYEFTAQELEMQSSFNTELQSLIQGTFASQEQPQISPTSAGQFGAVTGAITPQRKGQEILFIDDRSRASGGGGGGNGGSMTSAGKSTGRYAGGGNLQGTMLNRYMKQKLLLDLNYV